MISIDVSPQELAVIKALREPTPFGTITIKKSIQGTVKRITIHREEDIFLEEKLSTEYPHLSSKRIRV